MGLVTDFRGDEWTPQWLKDKRIAERHALNERLHRRVIACDLGRNLDRSVIIGLECTPDRIDVGNIEVFARRDYNHLADRLIAIRNAPGMSDAACVFDLTGVGYGVLDLFLARGFVPDLGVVITSGAKPHSNRDVTGVWRYFLPKADLIGYLVRLLNEARISINRSTSGADVLFAEMRDFQAVVRRTGHVAYEAPAGKHDDAVMALTVGIAGYAWLVKRQQRGKAEMYDDFTGEVTE